MKKYLIFAASALALASCSSDDFLGENPGNVQNATTAINFGGEAGKITRATSNTGTPQQMLDGQFLIYGVKMNTDNTTFTHVFPNYRVWNDDSKNTSSNTDGWEYVGADKTKNLGIGLIELKQDQTIKFWDYSSPEYRFVAGSPINNFKFNYNTTSFNIESATVTGLAGHITANETGEPLKTNPVYVAAPKKVKKNNTNYKNPVQFTFERQQAMVRVGIYETIPGYFISHIHFYENNAAEASETNNIILTSSTPEYFVGGNNISSTVTYDWASAIPSYTFAYDNTSLTKSQNWYAGKLDQGVRATTSAESTIATLYGEDKDMDTETGYFTVLPTPSATDPNAILIKCDYTLTGEDQSGETINVKGATAAIPAAFSKWDVNTRYTYLFKISQNTNGTTGTTGDPAGLYPITFAAAVTASTDAQYGTTTTVTTPSITTYQDGSVTENSIEYKTGKPIYATVANETDGTLNELKTNSTEIGNVQVYKLSTERTEADLQIATIFATEITNNTPLPITVPTTDTTVGNVTLDAKKHLSFKPTAAGWYAIQYKYADGAYKYKVIEVK